MNLPDKYATLSGVTSNLSLLNGLATIPNSIVNTLAVLVTVVGVGCLYPFNRWPTKAKWKFDLNESPTALSNCLKCHSKGSRVDIITCFKVWNIYAIYNKDEHIIWLSNTIQESLLCHQKFLENPKCVNFARGVLNHRHIKKLHLIEELMLQPRINIDVWEIPWKYGNI